MVPINSKQAFTAILILVCSFAKAQNPVLEDVISFFNGSIYPKEITESVPKKSYNKAQTSVDIPIVTLNDALRIDPTAS